jgi:hypothetical protein
MEFSLLYLLILIHLVVDFMQPAALVKWSKSSSWGLVVHSSIYTVLNAIALAFISFWWLWALVLGVSHFLIDKTKIMVTEKVPKIGLLVFVLDQLIHLLIIVLVFVLARSGINSAQPQIARFFHNPKVLLYIVFYVIVTFGGSILVFEVLNSVKSVANPKEVISMKQRYRGILERGTAMTLIVLGHKSNIFPLISPLAFLPSVIQSRHVLQSRGERKRFLLGFLTSMCFALLLGSTLYFL